MPWNVVATILWICAVVWVTAEALARVRAMKKPEQNTKKNVSFDDFE